MRYLTENLPTHAQLFPVTILSMNDLDNACKQCHRNSKNACYKFNGNKTKEFLFFILRVVNMVSPNSDTGLQHVCLLFLKNNAKSSDMNF